jgi:hypothetical protein
MDCETCFELVQVLSGITGLAVGALILVLWKTR